MKKESFVKIAFLVMVVAAVAMIIYPKLISSNGGSSLNAEPSAAGQSVQGDNQNQSQARNENQTMTQNTDKGTSRGEAQLSQAVKSGKPTMILFHSDS
ncbi:MAG: hypothetical protein HY779_02745 [Rubrobacteridae bacterium]|nr:hypothetical protein [Rubrobacteridae bacterium]